MAEIVGKMDISSSVTSPGANATQMTEVVEFPRPVMIFAAICASIFTVVGIGGKDHTKFAKGLFCLIQLDQAILAKILL